MQTKRSGREGRGSVLAPPDHDRDLQGRKSDERNSAVHPRLHLLMSLVLVLGDNEDLEVHDEVGQPTDRLDLAEVTTNADSAASRERDEGLRVVVAVESLGLELVRLMIVLGIIMNTRRRNKDDGVLLDDHLLLVDFGFERF